jgi:hypothetical protein
LLKVEVHAEQTCKEFITEATTRTMKSFFDCKKEMKFKDEEDKLSKMNVCILAAPLEIFLLPEDNYFFFSVCS